MIRFSVRLCKQIFRHKGSFSGGAPYWFGNWGAGTGAKKPHRANAMGLEYLVDSHIYGRTMQMSLEAHNTEWIHPEVMPLSKLLEMQAEIKSE